MERTTLGWLFVIVQVLLLVLIIVAPSGDDWATPAWLTAIGWIVSILGVLVAIVASLKLGTSLTPTPVPSAHGELTTAGLYRHVRHPIYTGVLAIVAGIVVRSGSVATLLIGLVIVVFFNVKARWEEQQLRDHYRGYDDYCASTPRFLPRP